MTSVHMNTPFAVHYEKIRIHLRKLTTNREVNNQVTGSHSVWLLRVRTGHGKPGKSWNLSISVSRPGKSWKIIVYVVNYCRCQSKGKIKYRQVMPEST